MPAGFRKRIWQLHSWLGLIAGLGLLVIGLTGSLLVFREELEALASPKLVCVEPLPTGRLSPDALLASAQAALQNAEITGWLYRTAADRADVIYLIPHGEKDFRLATIDPYRAKLLTDPLLPRQTLTGWLLDLHYEFLAGHTGVLIAGLLAAALCLLGLSGVWLYRRFWQTLFTLRWRQSSRIFFSDAHKMVGISSVAFNLVLGFTGAYWNLAHVIGEWTGPHAEQAPMTTRLYSDRISPASLLQESAKRLPGFRAGYVSFPFAPGGDVTLWGKVEPAGFWRGDYGSQVVFDAQTGAFKSLRDVRQQSLWPQILDAFAPFHFGSFGGLPIKILWSLGGLTPGILAVLGFLMWRARKSR